MKILWKRGEIAPREQFLILSTIFCYLMLDFYIKFSVRDKRLFEITEVEITTANCILTPHLNHLIEKVQGPDQGVITYGFNEK